MDNSLIIFPPRHSLRPDPSVSSKTFHFRLVILAMIKALRNQKRFDYVGGIHSKNPNFRTHMSERITFNHILNFTFYNIE